MNEDTKDFLEMFETGQESRTPIANSQLLLHWFNNETLGVKHNSRTLIETYEKFDTTELADHLIFYYHLKNTLEALNDSLKDLNKFKTYLQYTAITKLMNDQDVKTVTVDSIKSRFVKSSKLNVKGNPNSELSGEELTAKIHEWLVEVGAGSLIKQTVNAQSLSAFAKARIEQEGKDLPEELFEVSVSESISVTTVKDK